MDASSTDAFCVSEGSYAENNRRLSSFLAETKREVSCTNMSSRSVLQSSRNLQVQSDNDRPNFFIPGINGKARCLDGKNKPIERPTDVIIVFNKKPQPSRQQDENKQQQQEEEQESVDDGSNHASDSSHNNNNGRPLLERTESSYLLEQAEEEAMLMQPHAPSICSRLPSIYAHSSKTSGSVGESQPESLRWDASWHSSWTDTSTTQGSSTDWDQGVVKCPHPRRYNSERMLGSSTASPTPLFPTCPFSAYRPHSAFQSFEKSKSVPNLASDMRQANLDDAAAWARTPMFPKTIKETGNCSFTDDEFDSSLLNDDSSSGMVFEGWGAHPAESEEAARWNETTSSAGLGASKSSSKKSSAASKSSRTTPPRIEKETSFPESEPQNQQHEKRIPARAEPSLSPATGDKGGVSPPQTPVVSWRGRQKSSSSAPGEHPSPQITSWRGPATRRSGHGGKQKQKRPAWDRIYQSERCFQTQPLYGGKNCEMDVLERKSHMDKSWMNQSDRGPARRRLYDSVCEKVAIKQQQQQEAEEEEEEDGDDCEDDGEVSKGLYTFKSSTATTEIMDDEDSDIMTGEYCSKIEEPMDLATYARVQARREVAFAFRQMSVRRDIEKHLKVFEATRRKKMSLHELEQEEKRSPPISTETLIVSSTRQGVPKKCDQECRHAHPKVVTLINNTAPKAA